jgi:hypothetical protein
MAKGVDVAVIKTRDLVHLWGEEIVVRKSAREGARFPLYLAPCGAPVPMNFYAGQDFILNFGTFKGAANDPGNSPKSPEPDLPEPEPVNPSPTPEPEPEVKPEIPEPEIPENPKPKQSPLGRLLNAQVL